ncbi:hypothetical protein AGMMS49957_16450 [Synergistales bacterium]|nr:hypothetical protein AGMMS49957_16450 [Synergistales bacterium]
MLNVLRQYGIQPVAFLDKNASTGQTNNGVAVLAPDDKSLSRETRCDAFVFVSLILDKEPRLALYEQLKALGYANLGYGFAWVRTQAPESDKQWKESVLKVFDMFEDIYSQTVYSQNLSAVFSDNGNDGFVSPSKEIQYFDNTVPFRKNNMRFVDCGAFTGDTLESLCKTLGHIEAYAGFEPMPSNLTKFVGTAEKLRDEIGTGVIYPCAVGAKNEVLTFTDASTSSRVQADMSAQGGGWSIPVTRLDDTLALFRPTLIKMDIEGAETDALEGAKKIIIQDKPDLAICVYHAIEHYWTIPLMLRSWVKEYKFYLRTYSFGGFETVLYAAGGR